VEAKKILTTQSEEETPNYYEKASNRTTLNMFPTYTTTMHPNPIPLAFRHLKAKAIHYS